MTYTIHNISSLSSVADLGSDALWPLDPRSGMEKFGSWIRDKYPGSATQLPGSASLHFRIPHKKNNLKHFLFGFSWNCNFMIFPDQDKTFLTPVRILVCQILRIDNVAVKFTWVVGFVSQTAWLSCCHSPALRCWSSRTSRRWDQNTLSSPCGGDLCRTRAGSSRTRWWRPCRAGSSSIRRWRPCRAGSRTGFKIYYLEK